MMKLKFQFLLFEGERKDIKFYLCVISACGIFAEETEPGSLPIKRRRLVSEESDSRFYFNLKQSKASTASTAFYYLT